MDFERSGTLISPSFNNKDKEDEGEEGVEEHKEHMGKSERSGRVDKSERKEKRKKLHSVLSKSVDVATTVMNKTRIEGLVTKKLALSSLAAIDNYTDTGKRVVKPHTVLERLAEPGIVALGIRKGREAISNYIDASAVKQDKFYMQVSVCL